MKKILLMVIFCVFVTVVGVDVNASANNPFLINNNNIEMSEVEYNNLLNLGFTNSEILNMTIGEFNNNKDLIGEVVSVNSNYYDINNNLINFEDGIVGGNLVGLYGSFNGYIETEYKKVTTTIVSVNNYYRYKVTTEWKKMPSTRSNDIIGIGIESSDVYIISDITFQQNYCYTNGSCSSSQISIPKKSSSGGSAIFNLPTSSSINSLSSYLYFTVNKNTTGTITELNAYGDYSHATKTVSSSSVSGHSIHNGGIQIPSSVYSKYDAIPTSNARWTGTW